MKASDKSLGMDRAITRRDFINGVSAAAGAALLPQWASGQEFSQNRTPATILLR